MLCASSFHACMLKCHDDRKTGCHKWPRWPLWPQWPWWTWWPQWPQWPRLDDLDDLDDFDGLNDLNYLSDLNDQPRWPRWLKWPYVLWQEALQTIDLLVYLKIVLHHGHFNFALDTTHRLESVTQIVEMVKMLMLMIPIGMGDNGGKHLMDLTTDRAAANGWS